MTSLVRSLWLALALAAGSLAQADEAGLNAEQQARYDHLIKELRCLVCQNETIADSTAPLAADLRNQVRLQIAEGRDDKAILGYLTDRYGDFVLYRPPFKATTVLLWVGPFLLLLGALIWAVAWMRRSKPVPVLNPVGTDEAAVQRLLEETRRALAAQDDLPPRS